jgi:hypothetical protein
VNRRAVESKSWDGSLQRKKRGGWPRFFFRDGKDLRTRAYRGSVDPVLVRGVITMVPFPLFQGEPPL